MTHRLLSALLMSLLLTAADAALNDVCTTTACSDTTNHICDTNRATALCKVKETKACVGDDDCVAGAKCSSNLCSACTATLSTAGTGTKAGLCVPSANYISGTCTGTGAGSCVDTTNAACSTTCSCKTGYVVKYSTYSCVAKIDTACSTNADCVPGAECSGTTSKCACPASFVANSDKTACLAYAASNCPAIGLCITGATCTAATPACACGDGLTAKADKSKCLPNLGITCNVIDGCSDTSNVCDPATLLCKIKDGATCASPNSDKCTTGATCSTGGSPTCGCAITTTVAPAGYCQKKIDAGASCNWYDICNDPTICDRQLGKCVKKENSDCTTADTCVTGAQCTSSKCKCISGLSPASSFCKADTAGKPTGLCSGGACTDANAECKATSAYGTVGDSYCLCKSNAQFRSSDGSCFIPSSASSLFNMSGFITVIAAFYLGFHL